MCERRLAGSRAWDGGRRGGASEPSSGGSVVSLPQAMGHTTLAMSRRYAAMVDEDAFEESMRCSPLAAVRGR
jgi:hypothetical protein